MSKGLFISIEGGEGSGKSTVIQRLKEELEKRGEQVLVTREPGGIDVAERIRNILVHQEMDALTEAMLFASSRNETIKQVIQPALDEGKIVLCDRFLDSSLVYQGYVKGLGIEKVYEINQLVLQDCLPALTLYFDLDPVIGLERIAQNSRETNKFDELDIGFHQNVRDGYQLIAKHFSHRKRIRTIDASQSIEEVFQSAFQTIVEHLRKTEEPYDQAL